jgi:hypothetical protein
LPSPKPLPKLCNHIASINKAPFNSYVSTIFASRIPWRITEFTRENRRKSAYTLERVPSP